VISSSSAATVEANGVSISVDALREGKASLPGGSRLRVSAGALELRAGRQLVMRINAGSELKLPAAAGKWLGRTMRGRLEKGEVLALTGPEFPGARLVLETPEGKAEVSGTAIAVFRDEGVTCVCVLEGVASVGVDDNDLEAVPPGQRKVLFGDERSPQVLDIEPQHQKGLADFVTRNRSMMFGP
jgi:hypothetical protein